MLECLSTFESSDCIQDAARAIWEMISDDTCTVKMSMKSISELLHGSTGLELAETAAEEPTSTFLACQRRLVETSWQVMCTYWCVTCSQQAARLLARIAGITDAEAFPVNFWRAHDCKCLLSAVKDFSSLDGRATVTAAISQGICCASIATSGDNIFHSAWLKPDRDILQPRLAMLEALFRHVEGAQANNLPVSVRGVSQASTSAPHLFATDDLMELPGLIMKRPVSWPETCPLWCFLSFDIGSRQSIGDQIAIAHQKKAIFAAEELEAGDEQAISNWASKTVGLMQSIDPSSQ